jgi:hypothetical protein
MNLRRLLVVVLAVVFVAALNLSAQTLTTGDITGTVTDPTGAVIPNAPVSARNVGTGAVVNTTSNSSGSYRFSLLKPGNYVVLVDVSGFAKVEQSAMVQVGQATITNITLQVKRSEATIEVTGTAPVISTNSSENTTYSQLEVQQLPNAGGDITNIAQTAPGVVINNMMGYGNFTVNGMPATSNLFTVNGENDMDPYFNINNSGATNLTLGQNELQEATIISNPYDVQYGQLAGAQVSYVTRSGTNQFHGNADWYWNGRYMNSNDWIVKQSGGDRPFANANQWAGAIGGPILKDRTFFFFDTEGLRFVLPNVDPVTIPTPAFQAAILTNLATAEPNEVATYTKMFNLYNNTQNVQNAALVPNSTYCAGLTGLTNFSPAPAGQTTGGAVCAEAFVATPVALATEAIYSGRLDQKIGNKDNLFFRWKSDQGTQPTTLDPISSNFDAISPQPAYDGQANETHTFGPNSSNTFTASLSHYIAIFSQSQPLASNTFPFELTAETQVPFSSFNPMVAFPQGRDITQYQFIDDYAWTHGRHAFHFGENFRRYDVSDHNFFFNYPRAVFNNLQDYADGLALELEQADNLKSNVPVAMWGIGAYAQDEWSVKSNLKLTFGLRFEKSSNPVCQIDCFANFSGPASTIPSFAAAAAGNDPTVVPYAAASGGDIVTGLHQAYHGSDFLDYSPRVGFSWSPRSNNTLVLSGGFGLFPDSPAAGLVDNLLGDPPNSVLLRVRSASGEPVFDTTSPNNPSATFAASAAAFNSGFSSGQSYSQISSALASSGVIFESPAFTSLNGTIKTPLFYEWNFQVQKQIGSSSAFQVNYVGNHGSRILYANSWANAFDTNYGFYYPNPECPSSGTCNLPPVVNLPNGLYNGLLPASEPVPNYANVTGYQNGGRSNYDGVTFTIRHQFSHWVTGHLNYTYAHALDDTSNGGIFSYGDGIQGQICPGSLDQCNYGNADYDIRHLINGDFVVNPTFHVENAFLKQVVNGWQLSSKFEWRTGYPFQIVDNNFNGSIFDGGSTILAQPIASVNAQPSSCGGGNASFSGNAQPCLNAAAFVNSFPYGTNTTFTGYTAFSSQVRNQYRGPHYFNMDAAMYKTFNIREKATLGIGAQAFNVMNHPNFGLPDAGFGDITFGQISGMTGTPTSPYGNFLGFDSSVRVVQLSAKMSF